MFVYIHVTISFELAVINTDLYLKGSHACWRSGTSIDDGAGLPAVMPVRLSVIDYDCS